MTDTAAKIFWSWQSDYSPKTCRHFIREALVDAITQVANEIGVEDADRPEIDHDTTRVRYRSLARNALRQREESVRCPVRTGFFGRKARHHPSEDNFPAP